MSELNITFIRERVVPALRSEEYKQGQRRLRRGSTFCCLGVICDLAKDEVGADWDGDGFLGEYQHLPNAVADFVGLDANGDYRLADGGRFWGEFECPTFVNDHGATFRQIARRFEGLCDYVEANERTAVAS